MSIVDALAQGAQVALAPINLFYCLLGVTLGNIVGILPGIGPATGIALLIPVTMSMPAESAIIMLAGIYYGSKYGGAITSILLRTPGESSSVMTSVDGYELARRGRAGPALGMAAFASFIAGTASVVLLMLLAPRLAEVALAFGPAEFFALMMLGLAATASLSGGSLARGVLATLVGLALSTVGLDIITGQPRYPLGRFELLEGIDFLVVALGLFGIPEVLDTIRCGAIEPVRTKYGRLAGLLPARDDWRRSALPLGRSTLLGFAVGVLPGVGSIIASFLAYATERALAREPGRFGNGAIEAVAAAESADNAAVNGSLVPLLTLGIPGSASTAILTGALLMFGLTPGPLLFETNPDFVWGLIASLYIGNVLLLLLNIPLIGLFVQITRLPFALIAVLVFVLSAVGAFAVHNNIFHVWLLVIFGALGYAMRWAGLPPAPLILALVLGNALEQNFRRALAITDGDYSVFVSRPLPAALLLLAVLFAIGPAILQRHRGRGEAPEAVPGEAGA
ncbi:MAG TPA: tripartite tricarboxylate transporter permease [Thermodesulfobacteriota bacterium]